MNLLAYIQGKRKGKEAHRIEKEAMRDPFLAEALEGYDEVKADHAGRIARLRNCMPSSVRSAVQQKMYIGIAASLLFFLTVGGYFLLNKKPENLIAMSESYKQIITEEEIEMTSSIETPSPPPPNYLAEDERETATQNELRQRQSVAPTAPVSSVSPVISAQVQAEIVVVVEDEEMEVVLDAAIVAARVAETEEMGAGEIGETGVDESKSVVATRAMRSEMAKELLTPEPQIGMEAYEKYLKEMLIPLKKEDCVQTTGVVEVEFTVKGGKPSDFIIKQSFCDAASKEAIRLIENGCPWIGEDGRKVALKVNF